jgi:hypothetical protein
MALPADRLDALLGAIDVANADDPNTLEFQGRVRPKEQLHAELMTAWVQQLDAHADDAQILAARAHHLRRWALPRREFPAGRAGYLRWRAVLKRRHAEDVAVLLTDHGVDPATIERVGRIIRKEGLGTDPAVQVHEDALCLVFLQTQLDEVAAKLGEDKAVSVLAKTLPKMSDAGRQAARDLDLSDGGRRLLRQALDAPAANR